VFTVLSVYNQTAPATANYRDPDPEINLDVVHGAARKMQIRYAMSDNIGLGGQYATWVGTVLDRTHPIVIIANAGRENEAAVRLGRIGFDEWLRRSPGKSLIGDKHELGQHLTSR